MHSAGNGGRPIIYDGKIAGLYDLEETLGSGHFAVVKLARHVFTGEKVAVKVIDKTKLDEVSRAHLFQEVRCMKLVQHPNVVRLYEVIDTQTKLYLILELGDGGDLYDYIMKHEGGLGENVAREYFRQIVRAISYCHQLHVVHRDLKPENVVFFEKLGVVKLTDFGFSNKFCPGQKLETSCGSLAYSAPEILLGDSYDAPAVDIWSLGVILYMLVCGQPPFEKANDSETLTMIMDCKYIIPTHVSAGCRNLISTMLVREPDKRATLGQIAEDTWLRNGVQQSSAPEYLPLVSRQQVSDEYHSLIIQKMINGNISTKEEILDALDRNEYNHITATYFLLAERKLRQHRQDQLQKRRPELSLPVSASSSRLAPKLRIQGVSDDGETTLDDTHDFHVCGSNQITVPRIAAVDTNVGGRSRKCSIVQEEDDEDEMSGGNDELTTPFNRRGSRSEGRINVAIQERVVDNERVKNTSSNQTKTKGLGDICGVKVVTNETNNVRSHLGAAGNSRPNYEKYIAKERNMYKLGECSQIPVLEKNSLRSDDTNTNILTDSSISIPIKYVSKTGTTNIIAKYKILPSPTILPAGSCALNEIFEEGTDIGSSDSATTTPQPVVRNFIRNSNVTAVSHRRPKFHKTRTSSCSSSDASDDDSESRKKRVQKITDVSKPLQQYRRDSHDDSSDSQDPGNASASGSGTSYSTHMLCSTNLGANQSTSGQTSETSKKTQSSTKTHSLQKIEQQITFRRHRASRRRAGETRLRESQSLNRITEVQESDLPIINTSYSNNTDIKINNVAISSVKPKGLGARLFGKKNDVIQTSYDDNTKPKLHPICNETNDTVTGVELTKSLHVADTKSSSATKKFKMLGKYFQINKRICIPLTSFFQRGRLYKAQSCGSIVRNKININKHNSANGKHAVLFTERRKILRNCLDAKLLLKSDSDINQNNGDVNIVFSSPSSTVEKCNIFSNQSCIILGEKSSPRPLCALNDIPTCNSKC